MRRGMVFLIAVVVMAAGAMAQEAPGMNRLSAEAIAAQVKTLTEAAQKSATGIGVVTLEKYPKHYSMMVVRAKTGQVEIHANYDDVFFVLDCEATEMTGGTVVDAKTTPDGETKGSRLEGATSTPVGKGDVVHIAANTPHWMVLAPGKSCAYFLEKVAAK
jgi:mannose-6-phosphate isomerase-like protein (cupin superfamily)